MKKLLEIAENMRFQRMNIFIISFDSLQISRAVSFVSLSGIIMGRNEWNWRKLRLNLESLHLPSRVDAANQWRNELSLSRRPKDSGSSIKRLLYIVVWNILLKIWIKKLAECFSPHHDFKRFAINQLGEKFFCLEFSRSNNSLIQLRLVCL